MTEPVNGLPPLLRAGMRVCVVPPPLKDRRWHQVTAVSREGGSGERVRLSGVRDISGAQELVGRYLLADVDQLPNDLALHDAGSLLGRSVHDAAHGPLGSIVEVLQGPANDVWVIEGPYGEILVPVIDEVVSAGAVNEDGPIDVVLPRGVIEEG